jgi:hypothetical protein
MSSPNELRIFVTVADVPRAGTLPVFTYFSTSTNGTTWVDALDDVPTWHDHENGLYTCPLTRPAIGTEVAYVIDAGADADQRYLSNGFRYEDWFSDNIDALSSDIKAKTDMISAANSTALLSTLTGSGVAGPSLSLPQGQPWTVTITALDDEGDALDLTGQTVRFTFLRGSGSGATTELFTANGVNRSPATLGIADVAIDEADTASLGVGQGYLYTAKAIDDSDDEVTWIFTVSPAKITP